MAGQKNQALGIILFVIIGVSALALGVLSMVKAIGTPMRANQAATNAAAAAVSGASDQAAIDALKNKDTDGDGLSDYDELYVYHTSPYIKDTDSDGIDDGTEVKNGTDPLCPQGKNCGAPAPVNYPAGDGAANQPIIGSGSAFDMNSAVSGSLSAAEIRKMLLDQGLDSATLNAFTDDQLLQMYKDSANSMSNPSANANVNANANAGASAGSSDQASAAAQVRALLKSQGVTDDILNGFSDSELIQMYTDSAKAVNANSPAANANQ